MRLAEQEQREQQEQQQGVPHYSVHRVQNRSVSNLCSLRAGSATRMNASARSARLGQPSQREKCHPGKYTAVRQNVRMTPHSTTNT